MPSLESQVEVLPASPVSSASTPSPSHVAPHAPLPFLGLACAVSVSTIYYNQPLLLEMARSYGTDIGRTGFVAVATQVGYALGMLLFVPLGDVMERRSLMMRMYGAIAVALLLVAVAPNFALLLAGSALLGLVASVTHIVVPIAPDLVDDKSRGRAIGIVMMGLLLGILLARTFAGWVSNIHGWRWVFVTAAVINALFVPLLWKKMPKLPPKQDLAYGTAMRSLWVLFRTQPLLRESCVFGALVFASFSCFWTTLAAMLDRHYGLGPGVAGTFGVVGAAGAMVAPVAGKLADRKGPRWVITLGLSLLAVAYGVLWTGERARMSTALHMVVMVIGVIVLDMGAQMMQVSNQTRIFGLVPSARSRLNTVYMTIYFSGAALGSALATMSWTRWGWNGVSTLALVLIVLAALRHATGRREVGGRRLQHDPEEAVLEA
jgi:predicted MFS family arabinose efflux permease